MLPPLPATLAPPSGASNDLLLHTNTTTPANACTTTNASFGWGPIQMFVSAFQPNNAAELLADPLNPACTAYSVVSLHPIHNIAYLPACLNKTI